MLSQSPLLSMFDSHSHYIPIVSLFIHSRFHFKTIIKYRSQIIILPLLVTYMSLVILPSFLYYCGWLPQKKHLPTPHPVRIAHLDPFPPFCPKIMPVLCFSSSPSRSQEISSQAAGLLLVKPHVLQLWPFTSCKN